MKSAALALALICGLSAEAATKVLVTVIDEKTSAPITDLKAEDFTVTDGGRERKVEAASFQSKPVDVMLLVDTSLAGNAVQPFAADLIHQLQEKEEMALVSYHSSADMIQDFTASKSALLQALSEVKYGNVPQVLDAIYASIDGGFQHATQRHIVLLITSGVEGGGRVDEKAVIRLARKNGVSIFTAYLSGQERSLFRVLAEQTGGAAIRIQGKPSDGKSPAKAVFDTVRGHYVLTLAGNLAVGDKVKIDVKRPPKSNKALVSVLPLD
jgi:VWFA-related protein